MDAEETTMGEPTVMTCPGATGPRTVQAPSRAPRALLEGRALVLASCLCALLLAAPAAHAVIIKGGDGTGNTTPPTDDPGLANVGRFDFLSGVYVGNGWVLSANHITFQPFTIGGVDYPDVAGSKHRLTTPGGPLADLAVYKIDGDPGLPAMNIASIGVPVNATVVMYGNGLTRGDAVTWQGYAGWVAVLPHGFRWGANRVTARNVSILGTTSFYTTFDENGPGVGDDEAQSVVGDSGGAVFYKRSGTWELTGIMFANGRHSNEQPTYHTLYGNESFIADLSAYRAEILSIISQPTCDDGLDEDGDGLVDFPDDPGCDSADDADERSDALVCDDGVDDDGDGLIDYPADPGCSDPTDATETSPSLVCDDGSDNDGDGLIDWPNDPGCASSTDGTEVSPSLPCDDGSDNDGDGLIDWPADPGCDDSNDASEVSPSLVCDDGSDNDGDGLIDWPADPGCDDSNDASETSPSLVCDDGIDNDGDGLIDWPADPGCDDASDGSEVSPGLVCDDGLDNDGDGLTDWAADPGCDDASDASEVSAALVCDDGVDNDGDLLIDHTQDPQCEGPTGASEGTVPHVPVTSGVGAGLLALLVGWIGRGHAHATRSATR